MVGDVIDDAELEVRQRADGERHALGRETRDECGVFEAAVAMVDPVDLEQVERLMDIFGRALFAGVGDDLEAQFLRTGEDAFELRRRMPDFGRRSEEHTSELQSLMRIS